MDLPDFEAQLKEHCVMNLSISAVEMSTLSSCYFSSSPERSRMFFSPPLSFWSCSAHCCGIDDFRRKQGARAWVKSSTVRASFRSRPVTESQPPCPRTVDLLESTHA